MRGAKENNKTDRKGEKRLMERERGLQIAS